jgi:hypothetical protein
MGLLTLVRQSAAFTTATPTITAGAAGNTLVLFAALTASGSRTISTVACTNVTWTKLAGALNSTTFDVEIWFGTIAGGSSGTTVTITPSGGTPTYSGSVCEFSGVLTAGTKNDGAGVTNSGTSVTPATGAFTEAIANDLMLSCAGYKNGTAPTAQPGGKWLNLTFSANSTTQGVQGNYILGGAPVAQSASWTITSAAWVTCIGGLIANQPASFNEALHDTEQPSNHYIRDPRLI